MKLGKNYVAAIVASTAALVVSIYLLEDHNQHWVIAHPILDGAIGGAIIIPITGVIALAVIDRRLDVLARQEKSIQAEFVLERLASALRQSVRAALYSVSASDDSQEEVMDVHALRRLAKSILALDRPPTQRELQRIDAVLTMYTRRAVTLMDQLVLLTTNERAWQFSEYITDGLDFVLLGVSLPDGIGSGRGTFWTSYATLAELLVNATAELCPTALPLHRPARTASDELGLLDS